MKIEFGTIKEFDDWLKGKETKYELYIVRETSEVVACPVVSTRPVKIGVLKLNEKNFLEYSKKKETQEDIKVYLVNSFDFQVER